MTIAYNEGETGIGVYDMLRTNDGSDKQARIGLGVQASACRYRKTGEDAFAGLYPFLVLPAWLCLDGNKLPSHPSQQICAGWGITGGEKMRRSGSRGKILFFRVRMSTLFYEQQNTHKTCVRMML